MDHFLKEFQGRIQNQPLLHSGWSVLFKAAYEVIDSQLAVISAENKRTESEKRFQAIRVQFEEDCRKNGVDTPELTLKAFKDLILRY